MIACVAAHGCITCGDEALTLRVIEVDCKRSLALCADPDGKRTSVEIALVEPVTPGETLLVHAGTALGRPAADPDAVGDGTASRAATQDPERRPINPAVPA
jgi:hypothetical protein